MIFIFQKYLSKSIQNWGPFFEFKRENFAYCFRILRSCFFVILFNFFAEIFIIIKEKKQRKRLMGSRFEIGNGILFWYLANSFLKHHWYIPLAPPQLFSHSLLFVFFFLILLAFDAIFKENKNKISLMRHCFSFYFLFSESHYPLREEIYVGRMGGGKKNKE